MRRMAEWWMAVLKPAGTVINHVPPQPDRLKIKDNSTHTS